MYIRVWNGLDQSNGLLIQSSPAGFGLDWIRKLPTHMDSGLNWIQEKYCVMPGMYFLKAKHNDNAYHNGICRLSLYCRTLTIILEAFQVNKCITFLDWTGLVQSLPVRPGPRFIKLWEYLMQMRNLRQKFNAPDLTRFHKHWAALFMQSSLRTFALNIKRHKKNKVNVNCFFFNKNYTYIFFNIVIIWGKNITIIP